MPDRDATTIGDLIYYQYAKIIAKSAFEAPDGSRGQGKALRVREAGVRGIGRGSQELWGDRRRGTLKVHFEPTSHPWFSSLLSTSCVGLCVHCQGLTPSAISWGNDTDEGG